MKKNQKGFSPAEVLIVMAVGILIVVIASYTINRIKNGSAVKCGSESCINQKFASCSPAIYSADSGTKLLGAVKYHIYGKKGSDCSMQFEWTQNPNPAWTNQPMTCVFNNKKALHDSFSDVLGNLLSGKNDNQCTGPLVSVLQAQSQSQSTPSDSESTTDPTTGLPLNQVSADLKKVPYGQSYAYNGDGSFTLKINGVTTNPKVSGSAPSSGMEYLEVDIDVTNNGTVWTYPPRGAMYYITSNGKETDTLDDVGNNSNVTIPNKQSMTNPNYVAINPNQALVFYLLYEVPKGSNGKVVLNQSFSSTSDVNPAVALFSLH